MPMKDPCLDFFLVIFFLDIHSLGEILGISDNIQDVKSKDTSLQSLTQKGLPKYITCDSAKLKEQWELILSRTTHTDSLLESHLK